MKTGSCCLSGGILLCDKLYDIISTLWNLVEHQLHALLCFLELDRLLVGICECLLHLAVKRQQKFLLAQVEDVYEKAVALACGNTPLLRMGNRRLKL